MIELFGMITFMKKSDIYLWLVATVLMIGMGIIVYTYQIGPEWKIAGIVTVGLFLSYLIRIIINTKYYNSKQFLHDKAQNEAENKIVVKQKLYEIENEKFRFKNLSLRQKSVITISLILIIFPFIVTDLFGVDIKPILFWGSIIIGLIIAVGGNIKIHKKDYKQNLRERHNKDK